MLQISFISLALVCLLAGCSAPQTRDPATDESDSLDAYFEEEPADNEIGLCGIWSARPDGHGLHLRW